MSLRTLLLVMALAGAAHADDEVFRCPAEPATTATPSADDARWPLFAKVMPTQRGCIDGEVIGVLVAYSGRVQSAIGSDGIYALVMDRATEPVYKLGAGMNRLRQAHLPAPPGVDETIMLDGNGQNVIQRTREVKLSQGKAHELRADAHLVKIRVNGGRGSAPKEFAFHGDRLEILDGTKDYPLDVSRLLHATLERFASERRGPEWREQIKKATAAAVRSDLGAKVADYKRTEQLGGTYFTTWLPETKTLRVVFYGRFTRELRKPLPQQPGAKKRQVELRTYAAELAYQVDFDRTGKRVSEVKHPVSVNPVRIETESTY